jgi:hypothetical protein
MLRYMRMTITLDDGVAATLERLRKSRDASFKELVNEAMRLGLKQMTARTKRREPVRTEAVDLGEVLIGSIDNISEVLAIAEGP